MIHRPAIAVLSVALVFGGATACSDETPPEAQGAASGAASTSPASSETPTTPASTSPASSETPTTPASTSSDDPSKYCRLVAELDARGNKVFRPLGRDATPAEYRQAERRFVRDNAALIAQVVPALPARLRDEGQAIVTAMRQRAGLHVPQPIADGAASRAEKTILAFERRVCAD